MIGDFERGYRVPRLAYLRVLAALYSVTVAELAGADDNPADEADAGYIRQLVDTFPPLGPGQRDRLAGLFRGPPIPSKDPEGTAA